MRRVFNSPHAYPLGIAATKRHPVDSKRCVVIYYLRSCIKFIRGIQHIGQIIGINRRLKCIRNAIDSVNGIGFAFIRIHASFDGICRALLNRLKTHPKYPNRPTIPISFKVYLTIVDYTGRLIRQGKPGFISADETPVVDVMEIASSEWVDSSVQKRNRMPRALSEAKAVKQYYEAICQRWVW